MSWLGIRRIGRIAITIIVVIVVLTSPWVLSSHWLSSQLPRQWNSRLVIALAVDAALVLLAAIWWVWWRLPRRQAKRSFGEGKVDRKELADVEDNFRKTISQVIGGAAVLIGAGVAYLQFTQQQQSAHDLLISNQVSKGF